MYDLIANKLSQAQNDVRTEVNEVMWFADQWRRQSSTWHTRLLVDDRLLHVAFDALQHAALSAPSPSQSHITTVSSTPSSLSYHSRNTSSLHLVSQQHCGVVLAAPPSATCQTSIKHVLPIPCCHVCSTVCTLMLWKIRNLTLIYGRNRLNSHVLQEIGVDEHDCDVSF